MKYLRVSQVGAALASAALLCAPAFAQARHHRFSVNFRNGGNSCADLEVKSDGVIAIAAEQFTSATSSLEIDATQRGVIRVHGADRSDFAIDACKVAVADDQGRAQQMLAAISVSRSAGRVSTVGPSGQSGQ